ncbi:MAG: c-type cytochrome [Thiotrichales bacterium]
MSKLLLVLAVLVIITVVVFLGARLLSTINANTTKGAGTDEFQQQRAALIDERIRPVGVVVAADASAPKVERSGEEIVKSACATCHTTGVLGAPKIGEAADWTPRMAQGFDGIVAASINGKGSMPARGGDPTLTDDEIRKAVANMLKASGQKAPDVESAAAAADGSSTTDAGAKVYQTACGFCHDAGVAGAPKTGDSAAWAARIAAGVETMHTSAIKGIGAMPAKGGNPALSDEDVKRAVDYMIEQSGGSPAGGASATTTGAPAATTAAEAAPAAAAFAAKTALPAVAATTLPPAAAAPPLPESAPASTVAPETLASGKRTYDLACGSCHNVGLAGAPKLGDTAAWDRSTAAGMESVYRNAINGKGRMPPKGGRLDLSNADVAAAVDYLVAQSR